MLFKKDSKNKYLPLSEKPDSLWFTIVISMCILFLIFIIVFTSLVGLVQINQNSMLPNFRDNTFALIQNQPGNIRRGDVVTVITPENYRNRPRPEDNVYLFIKRVVATGGDTIKFKLGEPIDYIEGTQIYIRGNFLYMYNYEIGEYVRKTDADGNYVREPGRYEREQGTHIPEVLLYLMPSGESEFIRINEYKSGIILEPMRFDRQFENSRYNNNMRTQLTQHREFVYIVPYGSVYVLGDNRNVSVDSRRYGSFQLNAIVGRVLIPLRRGGLMERVFRVIY